MYPSSFLAIYDPSAAQNPKFRLDCFNIGANMVAHDLASLLYTIQVAVLPSGQGGGRLECPYCRQAGFTEQELWYHCPAYHINWPQEVHLTKECPICRKKVNQPMQVSQFRNSSVLD